MANQTKIPTQVRAINTKKLIIETAFKSFQKYGYKKTTTPKIAKTAKVSTGIVYTYFKDKKELFELWLNAMLENCDTYFYNQFKLLDYNVELSFILSNILEKLYDNFFSSPILNEKGDAYIEKKLLIFYEKAQSIFINCCFEANLMIKNPNETARVLFVLIYSYSVDLKNNNLKINKETLKNRYIHAIESLLKN